VFFWTWDGGVGHSGEEIRPIGPPVKFFFLVSWLSIWLDGAKFGMM
jgi:hypothetical protein